MKDRARLFWIESNLWSEATFGPNTSRGPLGPALHLEKEAAELVSEIKSTFGATKDLVLEELADCQHLVFDAARRAGFSFNEFWEACFKKLAINKNREWPTPSEDDTPVEHKK